MGNSTNKLPFSSSQAVRLPEGKPPFSYGFPMVFLWFWKNHQPAIDFPVRYVSHNQRVFLSVRFSLDSPVRIAGESNIQNSCPAVMALAFLVN